jgi:hypothetical protein
VGFSIQQVEYGIAVGTVLISGGLGDEQCPLFVENLRSNMDNLADDH